MSDEPKPVKEKKPRTQKQLDATARLVAMNKEKRALKLKALNEQVKVNVTPQPKVEEEPTATVIIKKKKAKKSLNIIEENLEKPIEKPIEKQVKPKAVKKVKAPPVPKVPKIKPDHVKKERPKKKVERANLIPEPPKPAVEESSDSELSGSDYEYTPKQIAEYTKDSDTSSSEPDDDEPIQ